MWTVSRARPKKRDPSKPWARVAGTSKFYWKYISEYCANRFVYNTRDFIQLNFYAVFYKRCLINISMCIVVNHNRILLNSSVNVTCFSLTNHHHATKYGIENMNMCIQKCLEICEISQIFTNFIQIDVALKCNSFIWRTENHTAQGTGVKINWHSPRKCQIINKMQTRTRSDPSRRRNLTNKHRMSTNI